ncbi:MAG: hemerythrin domain-containing protein [Bacteroidota bacterium]|nr:hemerythrin domain-containing protein [Bacteroidota bacterium]MDP4230790.1 hemerythrin domain-containing protein [Bacteroidota bacterium]MDP4235913.1 hemerythrin domain-containing protein [Bacteroidota bacterium]
MENQSDLRIFMEADHKRLDGLLDAAFADSEHIDMASYDQFRQGLLKHIGLEEKILLPLAQKLRGGEPLPMAAKLRLDHGALASLLVPAPTKSIARAIRTILSSHNPLEEGPNGVYEQCKNLAGEEAARVLEELVSAKDVPVATRLDTPKVMQGVRRALARAGFDETMLDDE